MLKSIQQDKSVKLLQAKSRIKANVLAVPALKVDNGSCMVLILHK